VEPAGDRPVVVLDDRQRPLLRRVGFRAIGVEPGQVVVHGPAQYVVTGRGGYLGQHRVDLGHIDALRRGPLQRVRGNHGCDHRHLLSGDHSRGAAGRHRRQLRQHPPGAHDRIRCTPGQPPVPLQPRRHALEPVVLRRLRDLRRPGRAGQLGRDPVLHRDQQCRPIQQLGGGQAVQIGGRQRVQLGAQRGVHSGHDAPPRPLDQLFE
jgi:hypothetical protein